MPPNSTLTQSGQLFYGDNLNILREHVGDGSVDLIYLDPPFNSHACYNVLFKSPAGASQAQIEAFAAMWSWGKEAEAAYQDVLDSGHTNAADMLSGLRSSLGNSDMMAFISMMSIRLIELRRVLKPTGSLYLHCDPTTSHYLKLLLDSVFSRRNFRNEITWRRSTAQNSGKARYGCVHDTILFYAADAGRTVFNAPRVKANAGWVAREYRREDEAGRYSLADLTAPGVRSGPSGKPWHGLDPAMVGAGRHWRYHPDTLESLDRAGRIHWPKKVDGYPKLKKYLTVSKSTAVGDVWSDIRVLGRTACERLGYATQKPVSLLERIVEASSNPGNVVLDPFCGGGTTMHAAQKLGRRWIGIDVTHLAIGLVERRLTNAFPGIAFGVQGIPQDFEGARDLARRDKYQFQWHALSLVEAQPFGGKKKGADGGIDGIIYFRPDARTTERAIVSVKGGDNVSVPMVRDLKGVLDREKSPIGVFLTLTEPTKPMLKEAASGGFYDLGDRRYARIQIITIAEALAGKKPDIPPLDTGIMFRGATNKRTIVPSDMV